MWVRALGLIWVILMGVAPGFTPADYNSYRVPSVQVCLDRGQVEGDLRSLALQRAVEQAFKILKDDRPLFQPQPDWALLKTLVCHFLIQKELLTRKTYTAIFDVTFLPEIDRWFTPWESRSTP